MPMRILINDKKLIECVKTHVELYNLSHPRYADNNYKENTWKLIAEQLDESETTCKLRWNNIRDNYRKSLKKRNRKGQGTQSTRKYKYEEQLSFLLPFLQERDTVSDIIEDNAVLELSLEDEKESLQHGINIIAEKTIQSTLVDEYQTIENEQSTNNEESSVYRTNKRIKTEIVPHKSKTAETTSPTLMKFLMEGNEFKTSNTTQTHAVDAFLNGIAPTLKSLSPYRLNIAKTKIFTIVQEMEMTQIMEQQIQLQTGNVEPIMEQRYSNNTEHSDLPSP